MANCFVVSEGQAEQAAGMGAKFATYAPTWTGPLTPEASAKAVLGVVHEASIEAGFGGAFVSHYGNKQWL